jgi:hypothetical protein
MASSCCRRHYYTSFAHVSTAHTSIPHDRTWPATFLASGQSRGVPRALDRTLARTASGAARILQQTHPQFLVRCRSRLSNTVWCRGGPSRRVNGRLLVLNGDCGEVVGGTAGNGTFSGVWRNAGLLRFLTSCRRLHCDAVLQDCWMLSNWQENNVYYCRSRMICEARVGCVNMDY